jgi:hypothetical protein
VALKGSPELRARLRAIGQTFKPVGKAWAETTRDELRHRTPRRTGATAASYRVRNASQRKATVVGSFVANILDSGAKAHDEKPRKARALRFEARAQGPGLTAFGASRTIFAKRVHHPRLKGRPFKQAAAREGLRKNPMAEELVRQWNSAA